MKFTTAYVALAAASFESAQAFVPTAFSSNGRTRTLKWSDVQNPSRGNVSYRKRIKPWHKLALEPWEGMQLKSAIDEGVIMVEGLNEYEGEDAAAIALATSKQKMAQGEVNGSADKGIPAADLEALYQAKATQMRSEAAKYLSQFEGHNGAHVIYSKLVEHGVSCVNGYSGGAVLPLLDQFADNNPRHEGKPAPIRWITNSNESSAGHVAEGIAKTSVEECDGRLAAGVVIATSGPGMTNLITPMQDAICDGVPLVVLCGQAATNAPPDAFQGAPAIELATPCTKWSYQIKSSTELPFVMDYAFYLARSGRPGPVFIDLPKDLQVQPVTKESIEEFLKSDLTFGDHEISESVKFRQDHMPDDQPHVARLQPMRDFSKPADDPEAYSLAISMGNPKKGIIPFSVGENRLEPVPPSISFALPELDSFRKDHEPTNLIYRTSDGDNGASFDSDAMKEMVTMIEKAKKPVIIAGQGCNDAPEELKQLAERLQIPVTTTLHALGAFDERHPLALNMLGMHGHPTPNYMIQECDLILTIGSRFDDRITGNLGKFIPEVRKAEEEGRGGVVHVDIRFSENAKQVKPTYFVHSTGKTFLQQINKYLDEQEVHPTEDDEFEGPTTASWLKRMKQLQKDFPVNVPEFPPHTVVNKETDESITRTIMSAQYVVSEMNRQILEAGRMDDCLFTTGVGIHQMVAAQLITWTQPRQMVSSGSLGTMGVSLGYCVGAKLANGNKICISIDGDGSFNMTFTELKTVAEQKIPVKLMILDNEAQMMVEYWQKLFFDERYIAVHNSQNPAYTKLADSFGIKNLYCDCVEDLEEKMKEFLFSDPDEPVLFHVRIKSTPCLPLVAPGQALDNMILADDSIGEIDKSAAPS